MEIHAIRCHLPAILHMQLASYKEEIDLYPLLELYEQRERE